MSRFLAPGSWLNQIWGSIERWPEFRVLVWNPNETTIAQVATGQVSIAPVDLSPFVERIQYTENIGYESLSNPQVTRAILTLKSDDGAGLLLRRGHVEDGVIVRIFQGDTRVVKEGWLPIFTGTFRGVPGIDPGTRATATEGMNAQAFGREERYLNRMATTRKYPTEEALEADPNAKIDIGVLAADVAQRHMGLGQDEVLFGAFGFISQHKVNQIVDLPVLQAIAECMFAVRKKPKFDELGRLKAVDVDFDKPPVRVYRQGRDGEGGDSMIRSLVRSPNDAEVATRVILKGLSSDLTRIGPTTTRILSDIQVTIGFFERIYREDLAYSDDGMLRATNTSATAKTPIVYGPGKVSWANLTWTPETTGFFKDRRGELKVDTVWGMALLITFLAIWLVFKTAAFIAKLAKQPDTAATLDFLGDGALFGLVTVMNFIGRGRYQIRGIPYEEVYQELESRAQLWGLDEEEFRTAEFRNDFLSDLATMDEESAARLRRELVKDQLYAIEMMDDPLLEVDDIIEISPEDGLSRGDRFYIVTVDKTLERAPSGTMRLIAWKIADGFWSEKIEPLQLVESA